MITGLETLNELLENAKEISCDWEVKKLEIIKPYLEAFEIIKNHKLLNYVLKNDKVAKLYRLNDDEIEILKECNK